MIHPILKKHCSLSSLVQLLCSLLTVFLIYQELVTFTVTRPTTVSSEEKTLDPDTFPEISVCLDPGLNSTAISDLGYKHSLSFYTGSMDDQKFVGRNGIGEKKNIVEEIINMKLDQQFFKEVVSYTKGYVLRDVEQSYTHPLYPRGRCLTLKTRARQGQNPPFISL